FPVQADPSIRKVAPWLRATPALSTLVITGGTVLASPAVLLGFAAISAFGASQRKHPFDRIYRRQLPDNPPPRRFAMGLAAAWATTAALLMTTGHRRAGRIAGGLLGAAGLTVATTHFCLGSWIYRQLERLNARRVRAA